MKRFVISDTHFGHNNILSITNRPFESVEDMNQVLIDRWNSVVRNSDEVYHLGDIHLMNPNKFKNDILPCLNGKIHVIPGNHDRDKDIRKISDKLVWVKHYYKLNHHYKDYDYKIIMFHYPIFSWEQKERGSIHLHGHSHTNTFHEVINNKRIYNVSCELNNYTPVLIDDIIDEIENRI